MARTLLDYMPVSNKNISKFLKNNFQNLSSYRIFDLVKKIPNEDEKLDNFVKYYDQISHGAFENSYLDLFTNDNKFKLLENLQNKIFDKNIYLKLNDILNHFENIDDKYKVIDSIKERINTLDAIDLKLIFSEIKDKNICIRILDSLNLKDNYAHYENYINTETNKLGYIDFHNINIVNYIKDLESDELKYAIIEKFFNVRTDIEDIEITRISMDLIKYINTDEYKNKIVELVKEKVYIDENNNQ